MEERFHGQAGRQWVTGDQRASSKNHTVPSQSQHFQGPNKTHQLPCSQSHIVKACTFGEKQHQSHTCACQLTKPSHTLLSHPLDHCMFRGRCAGEFPSKWEDWRKYLSTSGLRSRRTGMLLLCLISMVLFLTCCHVFTECPWNGEALTGDAVNDGVLLLHSIAFQVTIPHVDNQCSFPSLHLTEFPTFPWDEVGR